MRSAKLLVDANRVTNIEQGRLLFEDAPNLSLAFQLIGFIFVRLKLFQKYFKIFFFYLCIILFYVFLNQSAEKNMKKS